MSWPGFVLRPLPLVFVGITTLLVFSWAQASRSVEAGNRLYDDGNTAAAARVYEGALDGPSDRTAVAYNLGTALLALGSSEADAYLEEATTATDRDVARRAHYNLGVGLLAQADPDADPYTAALLLLEAIRHNRAALRLDPSDADARWNLALALNRYAELPPVVEEAPVDEPRGDAQAADEDPEQPRSRATAGGTGPEAGPPPENASSGEPDGPRTGAREALPGADPGELSESAIQEMLSSRVDDRAELIRGILWSQRPGRPPRPRDSAPPGGRW